jgi:hypothetical protein
MSGKLIDRVIFLPEHAEFSEEWRRLGGKIAGGLD